MDIAYEELYKSETGKSAWSDCMNCGRHSAYAEGFVEWLVNRERNNCAATALEMAKDYLARGQTFGLEAVALRRFAEQIESLEPFSL